MKKKLIILLLSLVILCTGCAEEQNVTTKISNDAVITHLSYGAFTLQEMAVQELEINSTDVTLSYYNYENELTSRYVRSIDEEMRSDLLALFENNDFMKMSGFYGPLEGQPIVADTGTVEISVTQDGVTKTVKINPYSQEYMPNYLREIDEKLIELKRYAMTIPEDKARTIAEEWIINAPTYSFDGSALELQDFQASKYYPEEQILTYSFVSSHSGYGDRSKNMTKQTITNHSIEITLENGEVISAAIDGTWDEINQIMLDTVVEMQSEQMNCNEAPWQLWYTEGDINFLKEPTEEELVITYFSTVYEIEVSDFTSVSLNDGMCQYNLKVKYSDVDTLSEMGWQEA
ncbi:hypothetical protein [Methanolobus sp.]|uniref:hypothetical protein n=1 Tax=Methanolobus sp. TaxID=1874737 RepID=UPI0025E51A33|nr:hypothetical protein [Methanolobus sp.]